MSLDSAKLKCKLNTADPIMLTLTLDNTLQYTRLKSPKTRLNRIRKDYDDILNPLFRRVFRQYKLSIEVSETLASEGKKFPRIHFHLVGYYFNTVELLVELGYLTHEGYGYHITECNTPEKYEYYLKYIEKQHEQWIDSRFVVWINKSYNFEDHNLIDKPQDHHFPSWE